MTKNEPVIIPLSELSPLIYSDAFAAWVQETGFEVKIVSGGLRFKNEMEAIVFKMRWAEDDDRSNLR